MQMKREKLNKNSSSSKQKNYNEDSTIGDESNSLLKILATTSIMAGGVLAYKKGAFRKATSSILDVADYYRKNSYNIYSSVKTFNKWANMSSASTDSIVRSIPKLDNIRTRDGIERIINDTRDDFGNLAFSLKKNKEALDYRYKYNVGTYNNTELLGKIKDLNNISSQFDKLAINNSLGNRTKRMMADDLHSSMKLSQDEARSQIKKNGYRSLMLEDIIDVVDKSDGTKKIVFTRDDFKLDKESKDTLEAFMKETRITYVNSNKQNVRGSLIDTDSWKDFRLDNGIMINEQNKIIDVRYASQYPQEFIRSLSNDFQIPLLNFNPLRFFGADKAGIKPNRYGIIHQSTVQNALTGERGSQSLKANGSFGDLPLLFVNGNVYQFNNDLAGTMVGNGPIATNMNIEKLSKRTSSYGIRSDLNAYRKMVGINTKSYELYTEDDGAIKSFFSEVMSKLDIGFQDRDRSIKQIKKITMPNGTVKTIEVDQEDGLLSPGRIIEGVREKIASKVPTPYKDVKEQTKITDVFGVVDKDQDLYLLRKKDTSLKDIIENKDIGTITEYFKDFFVSGNDPTRIGDKGIFVYTLADRLNQTLANVGLGLSNESSKSAGGIINNLVMKRFLPIYGAYQTMQYITYLSEREDENKGNIQKDLANVFKTVDLGLHKVKDLTGVSAVINRLTELTPGSDHLTELPGLYSLGIDRTYEEQKQYYDGGMDAVRKGRYWELGNTPFTGCLTIDSNIYTVNGYKNVQLLVNGEYVLTKSGEYHKIIATKIRGADELIYKTITKLDKCEKTSLTGNHHVLSVKLKKCKKNTSVFCKPNKSSKKCIGCKHSFYKDYQPEWIPISDIDSKSNMLIYPIPKAKNDNFSVSLREILCNGDYKVTDDGEVFVKLKQNGTKFNDNMVDELIELSKMKHKRGELLPKLEFLSERYGVTVKQLRQKIDDLRKNKNIYYRGYKKLISLNLDILLDYKFGKLIGYYASEGGYSKKNISFTFHKDENEYITDTINLLSTVFGINKGKIKVRYEKNVCIIFVNSIVVSEIFNYFVPGKAIDGTKKLSNFTMNINKTEFRHGFLEAMIKGDGYQRLKGSNKITIGLSCYELNKNIQHLLLMEGILSTINIYNQTVKGVMHSTYQLSMSGIDCHILQNTIKNKRDIINTTSKWTHSKIGWIQNDYVVVSIDSIETTHYIGNVYDFEIENEESFATNGYVMHNSKISYWKPNWYRRVQGDAMFSDSKYGSREEYFDNAWFSSPVSHFITDKYHYEKKHYYDRPYMLTTPMFEDVPVVGNILSGTVGKVIKPQKKMHTEYWGNQVSSEGKESQGTGDIQINTRLSNELNTGKINTVNPIGAKEYEQQQNIIYTTTSGRKSIYSIDNNVTNIRNVRKGIKDGTIANINGIEKASVIPKQQNESIQTVNMPNDLKTTLASQYTNLTNLTGMTGYITETFITGTPLDNQKVLDTMGYSMSFNKTFWDQEIGGIGGALSEIFRRFIPEKSKDYEYVNPIKNTMPSWMPGEQYFIDFTKGDPYTKVKWGEGRLPGEGYERLWGLKDPMDMKIGSSSIGKNKKDLRKHLLSQDITTEQYLIDIMDKGTKMHEQLEKQLLDSGIAVDSEVEIFDKDHNVSGIYDIKLAKGNELTGKEGIMDVKTVSSKKFDSISESGEIVQANKSQVNFYLKNLNMKNGSILYVDRDDPTRTNLLEFKYDKDLYNEDMQRLEEVRQEIRDDVENGAIGRGELYKPFDRVRILADVAPYSDEYKEAKRIAKAKGLSEEEELELKEIEERVKLQKQPLRVYDYKFSTANLIDETVRVDKVLDNGNFTIVGDENTSYSLGGINIQKPTDVEGLKKYEEYISNTIKPGDKIKLSLDADELKRKPRGLYNTVDAIVTKGGNMINRDIVKNGFAVVDEDDDSAIGVNVRYSKFDKVFGSAWEKFSHMDTYFHTKMLQVRSPLEMYERNVVYGEDFQEWERPIENFLKPTINRLIENPLSLVLAPFVGSLFGRTPAARMVMGGLGLGLILGGKAYTNAKEAVTGEEWKPKTRQKEEEIDEYIDKLKYVKNMKKYNEYKEKALKEDDFDVEAYMHDESERADKRKGKVNRLTKYKKDINFGRDNIRSVSEKEESIKLTKDEIKELNREERKSKLDIIVNTVKGVMNTKDIGKRFDILKKNFNEYIQVGEGSEKTKERMMESKLNSEINNIKEHRSANEIPENAMIALEYYQKANQTVYGYDQGESVQDLMSAIPKTEKDYFKYFVNAPEEERGRIIEVIPGYLKNAMMNMWGQHTEKEPLSNYFKTHLLPDESWVGWDENVNLDSVRVKMVNDANLEFSNFNIWQDDINEANSVEIPIPKINTKHSQNYINHQLKSILEQNGYENVTVRNKPSSKNRVNFNVKNDMRTYANQKIASEEIYV